MTPKIERCPNCGCGAVVTETSGHCNGHGEPDFQVTVNSYYCAECNTFLWSEVFET